MAAVGGWTAGSVGPIQIPVWPCWIHIGAIGDDVDADVNADDDLSASSRRSRINRIFDQTLRISEVTALCRSLATASWAGQNCCIFSSSGVTTLVSESSTYMANR